MLDKDYLNRLEEYLTNGDVDFEFEHGEEERRLEILDFLEKLMDVAEIADEKATKLIFKGDMLNQLSGASSQK